MRTISLCAIAAAVVAIGLKVWAAPTTTPVIPLVGQGVDPFPIMTNTTGPAPAVAPGAGGGTRSRGGYPFTGGDYTFVSD
jgi:hypothetical protein